MEVYLISSYPPRTCGIATFTQNLFKSICVQDTISSTYLQTRLVALTDANQNYAYPPEVAYSLEVDSQQAYTKAAKYLNRHADVVVLQHEFGIYGGQHGAYLLTLLEGLECPAIVTLHTVLKTPNSGQKYILQRISNLAKNVVVMSQLAKQFLEEIYHVPTEKIRVIEHGVPDLPLADRDELRRKLGYEGKKLLFTFGLLGRGKGIETAIQALPGIVANHPETLYVVLGKTHPSIVRENGEEYREHLLELARQKGVADNVSFINSFADEVELWEYLQACDVYVVPYLNEAQITSGTLSYAVGAGAAVVSTPFWHAQELLGEGRGRLFDFCDHDQLTNIINGLLSTPEQIKYLQENASKYGRRLKWSLTGRQYARLMKEVVANHKSPSRNLAVARPKYPTLRFRHLQTLTDSTGILQHAKYAVPNRHEGYCIDDNARALIAVVMAAKNSAEPWLQKAANTYLAYIYHCQTPDGFFRNFMNYERQFLEERGSEDAFGRTIWAMGFAVAHSRESGQVMLAQEIFQNALPHIGRLTSPRSLAYSMIGIYHFLKKHPGNEALLGLMHQLRSRLCDHYRASRQGNWHWFEAYFTYSNAMLPLSLFHSLELMPDEEVEKVALESTAFLEQLSLVDGYCQPIGCNNFYLQGEERSFYDQQAVDVMANALLFLQAYKMTKETRFAQNAQTCLDWFHGKNSLHLPLYDPETGGCCDGLTPSGVNLNQGAESTLCYLIARIAVEDALEAQQTVEKNGKIKHLPNQPHDSRGLVVKSGLIANL